MEEIILYEDNEIIKKKVGFFYVTINKKEELKRKIKKENNEMFFYIIKDIDTNRYKLGVSKNIKNRFSTLKVNSAKGIELIFSEKIFHAFKKESEIKNKLEIYKHHGEWFNLDENILNFLKQYIQEIKNI